MGGLKNVNLVFDSGVAFMCNVKLEENTNCLMFFLKSYYFIYDKVKSFF